MRQSEPEIEEIKIEEIRPDLEGLLSHNPKLLEQVKACWIDPRNITIENLVGKGMFHFRIHLLKTSFLFSFMFQKHICQNVKHS